MKSMGRRGVIFVGLGSMGYPMARSLIRGGCELHVMAGHAPTNTAEVVSHGAILVESLAHLPADLEVAVLMLPSEESCREIVDQILREAPGVRYIVDCSTISPACAADLSALTALNGVSYLDAPVSGGVVRATDGQLTMMVGGERSAMSHVEAELNLMASTIFHMGPSGAGQVIKACNNMVGATTMLASCVGLALAGRFGIPHSEARQVILAGTGANWQLEQHLPRKALIGDIRPGFALGLLLKDLGIARDMHRGAVMDEALIDDVVTAYTTAGELFGLGVDFSSVLQLFEDIPTDGSSQ